jgi:hypothetical protein
VTGYDALEELLAEVHVMRYPKPKPSTVTRTKPNGLTFVASDMHFPEEDPDAVSIFLQAVKDAKPEHIVLNGDLPDLLAVSRYPKDMRVGWSLADERKAMADFLWTLHDIAPQARITETNGNHSGDGADSRWWRYLSDRIGELASLPEVVERLGYRNIWHPDFSRVEVVQHATITKGLVAIHGDIARSQAAYSAKAMLEKWRVNLIHGHTHRMGYTGYRVPEIGGQTEHQMRAYEGGCLCKLEALYSSTTNWQQGFCIVRHDEEGAFGVEQVLIHKGKAISTTLGGTYRA